MKVGLNLEIVIAHTKGYCRLPPSSRVPFLCLYVQSSQNKTSRACQRRILYMMKNPATAHSVALHLEDVRQDPNVIRQFGVSQFYVLFLTFDKSS
jgi:hypothetical protein